MATTLKNLIPSKFAENAQTTQYTATNCRTIVTSFTATNNTANNVTFSVNLVSSGGSASSSNLVIAARQIAPGECYYIPGLAGQILEPGAFISTLAGAANAITIRASGYESTN